MEGLDDGNIKEEGTSILMRSIHWETAVTKKSVVFVPLYTLCGKVQNCTEGLQVMYIVTKKIFVTFYHLITNNRFVTSITSLHIIDL